MLRPSSSTSGGQSVGWSGSAVDMEEEKEANCDAVVLNGCDCA